MINDKTVLAIIPARGGSKGLPGKNIKILAGKPLIAHTIEQASASQYIDDVIVSTDDQQIAQVSEQYGANIPFTRPSELAQDDTSGIAPVLHAIKQCSGYDIVILLQPTSPLRRTTDIDNALSKLIEQDAPACISVTEVNKSPYWMLTLNENNHISPLLTPQPNIPRQSLPKVYQYNGAIYIARCDWLKQNESFVSDHTIAYTMPQSRSIDIDTLSDFQQAELSPQFN